MDPSRRRILQVGLAGGALLAVGGVGLAVMPGALTPPRRPLRALTPRQYAVLAAFAERTCPRGDGWPSADQLDVAGFVDDQLAECPPTLAEEVGAGLLLLENALVGLLLDGRPRTFTGSSPEQQDRILAAWRDSRLAVRRSVIKGVGSLCAVAYWSSPEIWPRAGYPGPPEVPG